VKSLFPLKTGKYLIKDVLNPNCKTGKNKEAEAEITLTIPIPSAPINFGNKYKLLKAPIKTPT
jgi:hypothetical protein